MVLEYIFSILLAEVFTQTAETARLTSVVWTLDGPVQGQILSSIDKSVEYSSFQGIPYAEPPLGYLRFKPPLQKPPWRKVFLATEEANICSQVNEVTLEYQGSEDCLYLNVYTPQTDFNRTTRNLLKPVMVWIYGGAFRTGHSSTAVYGPDFLIEEDVVLVTFNYRLGPFGFLNLNHKNATGNAALKDQNLVLRWVQLNIRRFGGNPNEVTIFGQSAGGVSVDFHVLSDMSKGLFHRSISMSGSPLCPWAFQRPDEAIKNAFILGFKLGTTSRDSDGLLQTLYNASPSDIIHHSLDISTIHFFPFLPTIEREDVAVNERKFLTECSLKMYQTGTFHRVPHMMGFVSHETIAFAKEANSIMNVWSSLQFSAKANISIPFEVLSQLPSVKFTGPSADIFPDLSSHFALQVIDETTDFFFIAGIDMKQKWLLYDSSFPIYYYRFTFDSGNSIHRSKGIDIDGVAHSDDLAYLFRSLEVKQSLDEYDPEHITRKRVVRMWTNFAKYGNPTPHGIADPFLNITWPESGYEGHHLEINKELLIGSRPTSTRVKLYQFASRTTIAILNGCDSSFCEHHQPF